MAFLMARFLPSQVSSCHLLPAQDRIETLRHQRATSHSSRPKTLRKSAVSSDMRALVLTLRRAHPTYGKAKIHAILVRDHAITVSESTIGRILKALMEQGLIRKYAAARNTRRKQKFDKHAKRWTYDLRPKQPGGMVQIDQMPDRHITINQIGVKHFQAWDSYQIRPCPAI